MRQRLSPLICLTVVGCLHLIGCDRPGNFNVRESHVGIATLENMAQGYGAIPFVIRDISEYKKCKVLLYHDQKAELVLEHDLGTSSNSICLALPKSPASGTVVMAWQDGFCHSTVHGEGSFGTTFSESQRFRKAGPIMSLLGTTFSEDPNPTDFNGEMWCFVVEFE